MGLAERKVKQRIGYDPRNLTWSNDTSRFSYKHMTALGWKEQSGIGRDLEGNANHIAVARKLDNSGIGMGRARTEGEEQSAGAGRAGAGLEDVLKRLAGSASPSPAASSPAPEEAGPSVPSSSVKNRIASRQRHLNSKRLASSSPAALAEILGVPVSSLPASPVASPAPQAASPAGQSSTPTPEPTRTETPTPAEPERTDDGLTKSTMSVADYFRQKLREKALARQAASGSVTPVPEVPVAVKEEKIVGEVAWEGTKVAFEETKTELADLGGDEEEEQVKPKEKKVKGKGKAEERVESKEERAARKEAKRLKKLAKEGASGSGSDAAATPSDEVSEKEAKRRRKEEKRAKKAEVADGESKEKKEKKRKREGEDDGKRKK